MKITQAELYTVAVSEEQYPTTNLPEIALAGRSNVGKSSFINKMLNRKKLAHTSQKPGKTQTLNFYIINQRFYFVDVPGYGFAKISKKERESWGKMIETYLKTRKQLKAVLLIVDIRHEPTKDDRMMYDWLKHYGIPTIVIATKCDKIAKGQWEKQKKIIKQTLQLAPDVPLIAFSAETGQGKDEAWAQLAKFL